MDEFGRTNFGFQVNSIFLLVEKEYFLSTGLRGGLLSSPSLTKHSAKSTTDFGPQENQDGDKIGYYILSKETIKNFNRRQK